MGFRNGVVATVWKIKDFNEDDKFRDVQISTSRKNRKTGKYEADFSGYVRFVGEAINGVENLKEKDRIVLKTVDVSRRFEKEPEKKEYVNFTVFEWEEAKKFFNDSNSSDGTEAHGNEAFSAELIPEAEEFQGGGASYDEVTTDEPPFN